MGHGSQKERMLSRDSLGFHSQNYKQETLTSQVFLCSFVYVALPALPLTHKRPLNAPWSTVYSRTKCHSMKAK